MCGLVEVRTTSGATTSAEAPHQLLLHLHGQAVSSAAAFFMLLHHSSWWPCGRTTPALAHSCSSSAATECCNPDPAVHGCPHRLRICNKRHKAVASNDISVCSFWRCQLQCCSSRRCSSAAGQHAACSPTTIVVVELLHNRLRTLLLPSLCSWAFMHLRRHSFALRQAQQSEHQASKQLSIVRQQEHVVASQEHAVASQQEHVVASQEHVVASQQEHVVNTYSRQPGFALLSPLLH